jgi:hypothetical protein
MEVGRKDFEHGFPASTWPLAIGARAAAGKLDEIRSRLIVWTSDVSGRNLTHDAGFGGKFSGVSVIIPNQIRFRTGFF